MEKDQVKKRIQELQSELEELQSKLDGDYQIEHTKRDILSITDVRLLKAFPDLIFIIDRNETFLDFYTNQRETLIVPPDQIIHKQMEEILPEFLVRLTREKMKRIFETGNEQTYNYSLRNDKGEKAFYESRMVKFDEESILAVVRNVTDTFHLNRHAEQQRDYLIKMLNTSPVGIIQLDAQGNLLFLNEELRNIFNIKKANFGKPCPFAGKLLRGKYPDFKTFVLDFKAETNYRMDFNSVNLSFNGIDYVFFVRAMLVRNPVTNDQEVLLYVQNITEIVENQNVLKNNLEKLYRNQKLLDVLLEKIPVAVFLKDAETRNYTLWNKAAEELFEINKEKVIGNMDDMIYPANLAEMLKVRDDQCLSSGIALEFIDEKINIGGKEKYINLFQMPLSLTGHYEAVVGIAIDNSNKKLIEQELLNAKEMAEKSDDLKSSFLANMSHEIRNPMNSIVGFSKILVEDDKLSAEEKTEFIELINSNANQLLRLLSDIIDIAKIENNELKIFKQEFSANTKLRHLKSMFEQILKDNKKADVVVKTSFGLPDENCLINTDEQRFQQIMNNLLSNSMRFTDYGEITMGYQIKNESQFEFFVRDTGVGISEDELDKIFKKFHQSDSYKRQQGGKGLGLSITKELVQYLGGEIWVESEKGKGSCFYYSLPREPDVQKVKAAKGFQIDSDHKQHNDWSDKTILIVDDRPDIISFIRILLKKSGINVYTATNGKKAIELVKEIDGKIDVILMDIQMPVMNGVEAMKIIKSSYPSIKILAQTAFALEGDEKRYIKEGFDNYVPKPINKKHLFSLLSKYLD